MSQTDDIREILAFVIDGIRSMHLDGANPDDVRRELERLQESVSLGLEVNQTTESPDTDVSLDALSEQTDENRRDILAIQKRLSDKYSELLPQGDEDIFPARLVQEDSGGGGEYDQWKEVESDGSGGYQDLTNGRTHTSTSQSLWESNGTTGIPVGSTTGTVVHVHAEQGGGFQYYFEVPAGYVEPAGLVKAYAGDTIPSGHLLCDGTSYLRATYPGLFTAIGTLWGSVDGTHFNVPDLRGRTIRGYHSGDTDYGTVGNTGGLKLHDLQHYHYDASDLTTAGTGAVTAADPTNDPVWIGTRNPPEIDRPDNPLETFPHEIDNRGPYGVCKWIIKT